MSRLARLSIAGQPHHVLQRGNNRQTIFLTIQDRSIFMGMLARVTQLYGLALHSYVLMDDHYHLLVTPSSGQALPKAMQALGRHYVRYFNATHVRTGTLWEGRYRSTVLQAERHLLACMAYIDLNPVRAGRVERAQDHAWSSHGHYAGLRDDKLLTTPRSVWDLGNTPFARESAYRELVETGLGSDTQLALTDSVLHGWVLGDPEFVAGLQAMTTRRLARARAGRPSRRA